MVDSTSSLHPVYSQYLRTLKAVVRRCGERYGLDDLELRDVRDGCREGSRTEVWWKREDRLVGWCELRLIGQPDGKIGWTIAHTGTKSDQRRDGL